MSERAQKILAWLTSPPAPLHPVERGELDQSPSPDAREGLRVRFLRQQTLADQLGCSRRSIGRALKELKEAGLLVDLNKKHQNRCKLYEIKIPLNPPFSKGEDKTPSPQGEQQLKLYRSTFEINFRSWPDWERYYPQVTWELKNETDIHALWRKTFDKLYAIRELAVPAEAQRA